MCHKYRCQLVISDLRLLWLWWVLWFTLCLRSFILFVQEIIMETPVFQCSTMERWFTAQKSPLVGGVPPQGRSQDINISHFITCFLFNENQIMIYLFVISSISLWKHSNLLLLQVLYRKWLDHLWKWRFLLRLFWLFRLSRLQGWVWRDIDESKKNVWWRNWGVGHSAQ